MGKLLFSIFQNFNGAWQINRTITPGGVIVGKGVFEVISATELAYHEKGRMTLDDGNIIEDVTRAYHYKFIDNQICVYYADGIDNGKLFHVLEFVNTQEARAEHLCGEDIYRSYYVFNFPENFTIQHDVKGPKKNYISETIFKRSENF